MPPSAFNPDTFLSIEITGASEVKYTPVPVGEYQTFIDDIELTVWQDQKILQVTHVLISEELKAKLGLEKPTVRQGIFLDLDEVTGALEFGPNKNVALGRLREACKQNDPKKKWNFNMLRGAGPLLIMVDHTWKENKETGVKDGPFAKVTRVARG